MTLDRTGFGERTVRSGDVHLRCVTAGPEDGPLVLFLHGFPARWSTWRGILPAFAKAGYRAVAPDLRGYGASDRPSGVDSYSMVRVLEDVLAILDAFGRERAFVVGHDMGGGVAWALAMTHPERVERLATLNSVHAALNWYRASFRDVAQKRIVRSADALHLGRSRHEPRSGARHATRRLDKPGARRACARGRTLGPS
jgi:pimeloyl-ACP methyl ester carboxylesterase